MKTYTTLVFLTLFSLIGKSQQYSFPLYFEDSAGNRDTLYFGDDSSATFNIDKQFGEENLINKPLNSNFEVFFTDAATGKLYSYDGYDCYLGKPQTPTYISKKQFNNFQHSLYDWIELGMITKNWPVTISWNQDKIASYISDQGNPACNLFLYSWNPPVSLIGDVHCCGYWPNDYTILNNTSQVVVNKNNFCHYASTISIDSVNLFFIKYSDFTGIADAIKGNAGFSYDPKEKAILFLNNTEVKAGTLEVYDILGRVQIRKSINNITGPKLKVDVGALPKGIYIISFRSVSDNSLFITQKINVQ